MKFYISIIVLAVICILLLSFKTNKRPEDVYGWDLVNWGMSSEELKYIFQNRVKERNKRLDKAENMYSGLQLRNISLAGDNYKASLWMNVNTNELARIVFVPENEPSRYAWAESFINLEDYLVGKYGLPDVQKTSNDLGTSADRIWNFPSTKIELSYLKLQNSELLLLVFSTTDTI